MTDRQTTQTKGTVHRKRRKVGPPETPPAASHLAVEIVRDYVSLGTDGSFYYVIRSGNEDLYVPVIPYSTENRAERAGNAWIRSYRSLNAADRRVAIGWRAA